MSETKTPGLDETEARAAAVSKTPWRVTLDSMKRLVDKVEYINPTSIPHATIAIVLLYNGYALQGWSAPADPENYNEELGKQYAYEDALRKMWPLEAYLMREVITGNAELFDGSERWLPNNG